MAGYKGYSMSNNAVAAYEDGERPKSKWLKKDILECLGKCEIADGIKKAAAGLTKEELQSLLLVLSSWHHTSSYYNQTDFYSFDREKALKLSMEQIENIKAQRKPKEKAEQKISFVQARFRDYISRRNYKEVVIHG